jgi:hypothetical protein
MLVVEPEAYHFLVVIFAAPQKEDWRALIDDYALSFNIKWNDIANIFCINDFEQEHVWLAKDSCIKHIDP